MKIAEYPPSFVFTIKDAMVHRTIMELNEYDRFDTTNALRREVVDLYIESFILGQLKVNMGILPEA